MYTLKLPFLKPSTADYFKVEEKRRRRRRENEHGRGRAKLQRTNMVS
jgi:hypothetical protein